LVSLKVISSRQNPFIKHVAELKEKKLRQQEGVFVIEGEKEMLLARANGVILESIIYCPEITPANRKLKNIADIESWLGSAAEKEPLNLVEVTPAVYAKIAYREQSCGLIAVAKMPQRQISELILKSHPLILVIEGVEKPGNLGALLRTADGAGVDAVVICDTAVDLYNPNVIRGSLGAIFTVKVFVLALEEAINYLKSKAVRLIFTSPAAELPYTQVDYTGPTAIVLGSEKEGLPRPWLETEILQVKIPLCGQMDSLNVSCSGAVILYEAQRQRNRPGK